MATAKTVFPIKPRIPGRWAGTNVIRLRRTIGTEAATDDLFDLSLMEIDARSKHGDKVEERFDFLKGGGRGRKKRDA